MVSRCCMAGLLGVGRTCTVPTNPITAMRSVLTPRRGTQTRTHTLRGRVNVLAGHSPTSIAGQRQNQRPGRPQDQSQAVRASCAQLLDKLTENKHRSGHAHHRPVHPGPAPGTRAPVQGQQRDDVAHRAHRPQHDHSPDRPRRQVLTEDAAAESPSRHRLGGCRRVHRNAGAAAACLAGRPKSGRLLLLSCGGAFDNRTGHYESNIFVYALPT